MSIGNSINKGNDIEPDWDEEIDTGNWFDWTAEEHEKAMDEYDEIWDNLCSDLSQSDINLMSRLIYLERAFVRLEDI